MREGNAAIHRHNTLSQLQAGMYEMRGGGGGGLGPKMLVYQKWPNQIFPLVNLNFYHDGHVGLGGGGAPMVVSRSTTSLASGFEVKEPGYRHQFEHAVGNSTP